MKTFAGRRIKHSALLTLVAIAIGLAHIVLETALFRTEFATGWLLAGLIVLLAAYNVVKKLSVLPLGSSAKWMQLHIYAGLLTILVFGLHIGFRVPTGPFEIVLASIYLLTFFSGVVGLVMSRTFPSRLATHGEEVLFERIPVFIRRLREEVEELVFGCVSETETTVVPEFYLSQLKPFFERPRNFWSHLVNSARPRRGLLQSISEQDNFLNDTERESMRKISQIVVAKDNLDYQYALQGTLKSWLFVHIPATYALLILTLFHTIVVHAFAGMT